MSVPLIVAGVTYNYPATDNELWGVDATNWAIAITSELAQVTVTGDIGPTTLVTIANNQVSAANVTALVLNSATIRSGTVEYYVYRIFDSGAQEVAEAGNLYFLYHDLSGSWTVSQVGNGIGSTGVLFTITAGGQVQYTSSDLTPSSGYSGSMKYRLRVLQKT